MLLADFYVQQLKRQNASKIDLVSNEAIRFSLPQGDKQANSPIHHDQIVQLIQEIAATEALESLTDTRQGTFAYPTRNPEAIFTVIIHDTQRWQVTVKPASASAPEVKVAEPAMVGRGGRSASSSDAFGAAMLDTPTPSAPNHSAPISPAPTPSFSRPANIEARAPQADYSKPATPAYSAPTPSPSSHSVPAQTIVSSAPTSAPAPAASPKVQIKPNPNGEPRMNYYLRKMIEVGASDLHMSSTMPPLVRLHGEMEPLEPEAPSLSNDELRSLLLEILPEKNVVQFEESWDTDFAHAIEGLSRFRANYFMDQNGVGAVFRQIPFEILTPEQLGLPEQVLDLCWLSKGLVLVTGPTGSGKSTTLASMIDYINRNRKDHIITIEDPVEFVHPNKNCLVNQREIGSHTKGFKAALKAALREDPDIVLVGEMRDLETIAIAIETAETGHLVFGTLHTTTAPSTVDRLIDQFPAEQQSQIRAMLSESLKGVVAQVLCKAKPKGRAAAYEILISNSAISNQIREGKTHQLKSIMQTGKKEGMCTMNDSLLELVVSGRVDAKEAYIKSVDKQGLKIMFQSKGIKLELDVKTEQA